MSGAMENRAAVFTSSSQEVEVYQAGAWWPGSLLGWRHEPDGSCQVWVRVVVAGVERSTWTDLAAVRLPERPALHPLSSGPADDGRDALTSTISLFPVRDDAPVGASGPATVVGGLRAGGRRRAPESQETPAWRAAASGAGPAPAASSAAPAPAAAAGRHRAPVAADDELAAAGRHRAADTGVFAAVPADASAAAPARPVARTLPVLPEPAGGSGDREFYTRPLRLATSAPQPRAPRWDD